MKVNQDAALAFIFREEGGFVNDPHDPGGATNMGITIATLSRWLGKRASVLDVKNLEKPLATAIYEYDYFAPIEFNNLPAGIDVQLVDIAVNAGVGEAHAIWDRVKKLPPSEQVLAVYNARTGFYRRLRNFFRYGKVWTGRAKRCYALACQVVKRPGG